MKYFRERLLLSVVTAILGLSTALSQSPASEVYKKTAPATVLIRTEVGGGTGFIVQPDGVIATAWHVIEGAASVGIKTQSGEIYDQVYLLAKDERRDIALLKIAGFDLPVVELGNSNNLNPGDHIVVIGNPLAVEELQTSVSDGIVSGIRDLDQGFRVIQLTAPISPGNSGGPVLSENGQVVGVAVFKVTGGESLNFAVPINYVRGLLSTLSLVDQTNPLAQWGNTPGSEGVFSEEAPGRLTGYWKSSNGPLFYIQDDGDQVKVLNVSHPQYTYDFHWEGDLILGTIYSKGKGESKSINRVEVVVESEFVSRI